MNQEHIKSILRKILNQEDLELVKEEVLSRKKSQKHDCEIEVLIEHISLLVTDLRFATEASNRELFEARQLLE